MIKEYEYEYEEELNWWEGPTEEEEEAEYLLAARERNEAYYRSIVGQFS